LVKGEGGRVWLACDHNRIVREDADVFHVYGQQDGLELNTVFTFYDLTAWFLPAVRMVWRSREAPDQMVKAS